MSETGIGASVRRKEDVRFLTGAGQYVDDITRPGQTFACFLRSPHAHATIKSIKTAKAEKMPGVAAIFTGKDIAAADLGGLICGWMVTDKAGQPMKTPGHPLLALDTVRYVGDHVAVVIADTQEQAMAAAEAIDVTYDAKPALVNPADAMKKSAPQVHSDVPQNLIYDWELGDRAAVDAAFKKAHHVTSIDLINNRLIPNAMEPRAALGEYDRGSDSFTLYTTSQNPHVHRLVMSAFIKIAPETKLRVIAPDVGGGFGSKIFIYAEECVTLWASKKVGRPVKWTAGRGEAFLSDAHGRDHEVQAELALDTDGRFLAVRLTSLANMGAWLSAVAPLMGTANFFKNVQSNYATPAIEVRTQCVLTNTTPVSAYRGAGRPEGNYFMERLIDQAARDLHIDPVDLRKRNHIAPGQFPYKAASGSVYDGGAFSAIIERAMVESDGDGYSARQVASTAQGLLRGRGIGNFLECTAPPTREQGGIRFEADGTVTIITGTLDYGQGHWSAFAQVLHQSLGVPFAKVRLSQGDSDELVAGGGTGGSKSIMASGAAVMEASAKVIEKGRAAAAWALEAAVSDIEYEAHGGAGASGRFVIAGTDRQIGIMELAAKLRATATKPEGVPETLDVTHVFDQAPQAYPNGCHVCEVEIDPETGIVRIDRYLAVNDFGVQVNPLLVAGQAHGGIAQGVGQALMEHVAFSEDGQLLSGSFMDYAMPRAGDLPSIDTTSHPVPCTTNPLGAKGCGEAGCAGSLPAVMNAVVDALRPLGIAHINMPATPERVWLAIQAARG